MGDDGRLEARLIAAHRVGDLAALTRLYSEAAEGADTRGDADRAAFYRTHAMVFALEAGDPWAKALMEELARDGRV